LLDEPTAGLDPQATREFYTMLDGLRADGVSILISSHVLPGIERHIDRAIILGQGRLLAQGSMESLRAEASLPLTIRARGDSVQLQDREPLERLGYSFGRINERHVEIQGMAANKVDAIRYLVNVPGIEDIEVIQPSLEHLYAHFTHAVIPQEVD
jgi:Cu-processing system ATP-binding protein